MEDKLASSSDMLFANVANLHTTYVYLLTYQFSTRQIMAATAV